MAVLAPHVMWMDNFSKLLPLSIPRNSLELFKSCLWTVYGFNQLPVDMDLSLVYDLPAMPPQFHTLETLQGLRVSYTQIEGAESWQRFEHSLSRDICRVPLEVLQSARERGDHILSKFFPYGIRPVNVGANHVLVDILEEYLVTDTKNPANNYQIVMTDINIYQRILKVPHNYYSNSSFSTSMIPLAGGSL